MDVARTGNFGVEGKPYLSVDAPIRRGYHRFMEEIGIFTREPRMETAKKAVTPRFSTGNKGCFPSRYHGWIHGIFILLATTAAALASEKEKADLTFMLEDILKRMKKFALPVIAGAMLATPVKGQLTYGWSAGPPDWFLSDLIIANTNNGAIYDSYTLFLEDLANQIYENNPNLHTNYSSGADLIAAGMFVYGIQPKPPSEVAKGWSPTIQPNGDIKLTHSPLPAPLFYDEWKASQQSPKYWQNGTLGIKKLPFLDLNGDGTWNPTNDLTIANDNSTMVWGGFAYDSGNAIIAGDEIPRIIVVKPIEPTKEVQIDSKYSDWFGNDVIGDPIINDVHTNNLAVPYGDSVTSSVETFIYDPTNARRRLKAAFSVD